MTAHTPTLAATPAHQAAGTLPRSRFLTLALGSIGVVYGDIGTSPLYAVKESVTAAAGGATPTPEIVLGVLSLILWALVVVVTLKYVVLMLQADNHGEGGTLTLMALAQKAVGHGVAIIPVLGIAGAALFYGDAMITPAISVLSAVEGLNLVTPAFGTLVVPVSIAILIALFAVQSRGTASVAVWFGPITLVWFVALAAGGVAQIAAEPGILAAVNPLHGARFLREHGLAGLVALGAVFLAVTGAEALYADLGHFGRGPIRAAWLAVVFPALVLNYLGQGALLIVRPEALENPFFRLYPEWALLPMVAIATVATIIASQAVITGAFSMTQQAMQLGLLPRLEVRRTSETEKGQIYIPRVNIGLLLAVLFLVQAFRTSSGLAAAYGIAVTGTMVVTALLAFVVVWRVWGWPRWAAATLILPFLVVDALFLGANTLKIAEGGWLPLVVGGVLLVVMLTWRRGTHLLAERAIHGDVPLAGFVAAAERGSAERVPGTAVFLTGQPDNTPTALLHNLKHNRVLHARNVVLAVETADAPRVDPADRATVTPISESFTVVRLVFGYMEAPDVVRALAECRPLGLDIDLMQTSFFLSRRKLKPSTRSPMPRWQDKLFIALSRRADDASAWFGIPTGRVVEIGTQIVI
ncbi:potassium transporter Kup [Alsobacter sp. SYSU M60028]|uniref:Probable potassium transport system protein Kup n=1 Tax=Alsobacter ponti TaxID=2962936 RepID=A0ABT1LC90_9HYPH|nr:potassium transporter Kup [Alsobacter ponti]MCP8939122.1 potassium transporter Kup [Alsobacter ponti]